MKKIMINNDAHIEGYEGAFCREFDKDGNPLATGVWDNWYEASAQDDDGNEYIVYFKLADGVDVNETMDETDACDWDNPWMVIDEDGRNVVEDSVISWREM